MIYTEIGLARVSWIRAIEQADSTSIKAKNQAYATRWKYIGVICVLLQPLTFLQKKEHFK